MNKETNIIIKFDTSPSPWSTNYQEIEFSRDKIETIADELINECSGKDYTASYAYGKHVSKVIEIHWDNTCGSVIPLYKALIQVLKEKREPKENWYGGATSAIRCLQTRIAYATPGFVEAKRYRELYGD